MNNGKKAFSCLVSAMMVMSMTNLPVLAAGTNVATGTQKAYLVNDDWGSGVTKSIMALDKTIKADSVSKGDFTVEETAGAKVSQRTIVDAYTSNAKGDKVKTDSNIVTVEMAISPSEGSPIAWDGTAWRNNWANPYKLNVQLAEGEDIKTATETITEVDVDPTIDIAGDGKIVPQLDGFSFADNKFSSLKYTHDGDTVSYSLYTPKKDNHKNALVIWNHGIGETGTDVQIDLLGNEVTALGGSEFQNTMDGAYVLVPQRSYSTKTSTVYNLIQAVLKANPDIDADKVIIGGCSAGGLFTMNMIIDYPTTFAAAYPICAAKQSKDVSDETINSLKNLPIWFIHAKNDNTVKYETTTEPLAARLRAAGNTQVHVSAFDDVHDTTGRFNDENGNPHQYDGHWSWTYFDNNECYDENGVNLWKWMAKQTKAEIVTAKGSQKAYVTGEDWGAAVPKTVVKLDKAIDPASISADNLKVVEEKNGILDWGTGKEGIVSSNRTVTAAYTSDDKGNKVNKASNYITIEMYVSPSEGSPFIYRPATGRNSWCNPYRLNISLANGATLTAGDETINNLEITQDIDVEKEGKLCPQLDKWTQKHYKAVDGIDYSYAEYTPAKDDKKNALVIWLHGAGEGGTDTSIDLLANEVTNFAGAEFQKAVKDAYVIAPQCPTMWMDGGNGEYQNGEKGSIYAKGLFDLIDTYVKNNPDIDANKIYIGGCSNGGYMTMEMILKHPDYFAAAFPICEAYYDEFITDKEIESLKDLPIWFTYAKTDDTVDFTKTTEPTVKRLLAAGAKNVHVSAFDDVHDTSGRFVNEDGTPYEYSGHWSWIYWDNNECYDGDLNAWEWLGQQAKTASAVVTPDKDSKDDTKGDTKGDTTKPGTSSKTDSTVKTGDDTAWAALSVMMMASAGAYIYLKKREHVR